MSIELLDDDAPDVEQVVAVWLRELGRAGTVYTSGDQLPYRVVKRVAGTDDLDLGDDFAVISVHTFAATMRAAKTETRLTHRRMNYLARYPHTDIELSDGTIVNIDSCVCTEKPTEETYSADVVRYVARYRIGLAFTPAGS